MKLKSILLCILFFVGAANFYEARAQINISDSLALVDLYNSTNGPSWNNNSNWLTTEVYSWYGISTHNSRVTGIELVGNSLSGPIPASIGNLTGLRSLRLDNNNLTGSIPASIGNLIHIESLGLPYNQLTNEIPAEIGNLVKCTFLFLSNNLLTGSIPSSLGNLTYLTQLYLNNNQLTGSIPEFFKNFTGLLDLDLGMNQLSGKVPVDLFKGKSDLIAYLNFNHLTYKSNVKPTLAQNSFYLYDDNNNFTFDGIEYLAQELPGHITYFNQASLPLHKSNKTLRVYAGGTLANNTYKWFRKGSGTAPVATITGDSTFTPTESGMYYAKVRNSVVTDLTLYSDTVKYKVDEEGLSSVSLYPNPVKNTLIIKGLDANSRNTITVTNISGNILVAGIADKQSTANYDVSKLKPGNYVLNVTNGEEIKTLHFIKE